MEITKGTETAAAQKRAGAPGRGGGSIVYALAIIRHLSESGESRGVTAIAKQLRISPSSCFNILKTLVSEDVVEFYPRTKTYAIGYGLLHTVGQSLNRNRVLPLIAPGMRLLADKSSTAIGLWRLDRTDHPLLIWLAETEASIRVHLTVGQRLPVLAGATGRCVAAHRMPSPAEFSRLYAKLRLQRPISESAYLKEIEKARERGFAVDADCYIRGVTTVAVPILGVHGELAYCLSATMFTGQHDTKELPVIGEELRALANRAVMFSHSTPTLIGKPSNPPVSKKPGKPAGNGRRPGRRN